MVVVLVLGLLQWLMDTQLTSGDTTTTKILVNCDMVVDVL